MAYIPDSKEAAAVKTLKANLEKLADKDKSFATSLLGQLEKKGTLSPKQWPWVVKLAARSTGEVKPVVVVDCAPLIAMFDTAAQAAKYPKITIKTDEGTVQLSRAGAKATVPGSINVTDGLPYGENKWFGRILLDGTWQMSGDVPQYVVSTVKRLSADPAGMAKKYAKVSGHCCFCNTPIESDESMAVGYGPICAKKFGLAWGTKVTMEGTQTGRVKFKKKAPTKFAGVPITPPTEPEITAEDAGFNCAQCMDEGIIVQKDGSMKECTSCAA